jgi:hypothetical protein
MKILVALVTVVCLSAAPALAGDRQISKHSLARMGLQGMTTLSDADGMSIRGQAILVVVGHSFISNYQSVNFLASATGVTSGTIVVAFSQSNGGLFTGSGSTASAH